MKKYTLPELRYTLDALEPFIDARTMEIHHGKHHAAYVAKLNEALDKYPELYDTPLEDLLRNIAKLPQEIREDIRNHGGGHYNHSHFWNIMHEEHGQLPMGILSGAIDKTFGGFDAFQKQFEKDALLRFGSGWAWLYVNGSGTLSTVSLPNQENPLMYGNIPVLGLDVWEHAYYLKYQNRRADYIRAFWNVINWRQADENYRNALHALKRNPMGDPLKKAS